MFKKTMYHTTPQITELIKKLEQRAKKLPLPMSTQLVKDYGQNPFILLISCLLSLRTRDKVTYPICQKLFSIAKTPQEILAIPNATLEKLLHGLGFYRKKAHIIHHVSKELLVRFKGKVPATKDELLSIKGVGPKTANLVLAEAFNIPAICVDTHVQAISNKLGLVHTTNPLQTEKELEQIIPKRYWKKINRLMVTWGQNRCKETGVTCPVHDLCTIIYKK